MSAIVFMLSAAPDEQYYRTAEVGQTVKFRCPSNLLTNVDWFRHRYGATIEHIYWGEYGPIRLGLDDPRFVVLDKNHSHSLVIYNITVVDSASYVCAVDDGDGNRRLFGLTVQGLLSNNLYIVFTTVSVTVKLRF